MATARCRLTNARTGVFVEPALNPTSLKLSRGTNISSDPLPMASHALVRPASGGEVSLAFELQLVGELSLRLRGANLANAATGESEAEAAAGLGVDGEIEWLTSFTYPVNAQVAGARVFDEVIFSYGRAYPAFRGYMKQPEVTHTMFTQDGRTMRASVKVTIIENVTYTQFSNEVYAAGYEGFIP